MSESAIRTGRLRISVLDLAAVEALVEGDAVALEARTGARFDRPSAPPHMADTLPAVRDRLRAHPEEACWWSWLIAREDTGEAVGVVALAGPPDDAGRVLVGYAVYPEHEGHGFATEALRALIGWIFAQADVREVRALAPVWNTPALRVAENVGMRPVASEEDDDVGEVLVYALTAPASAGSA
jgi:ribosomal-protein-alanine N-acetyltransferase